MPPTDRKAVLREEPEGCVGTCFACVAACERRRPEPSDELTLRPAEAPEGAEQPAKDKPKECADTPPRQEL